MLPNVRNNIRSVILLTMVGGLVVVILLTSGNFRQVQADVPDMHNLLQRLSERMKQQETLLVFLQFHTPLSGKESSLVLNDTKAKNPSVISEIGTDYVCFSTLAGQAEGISCTPFSNLASISYLNN